MSRSHRHHPIRKDRSGSKGLQFEKRLANKRIRRSVEVPQGKVYRKFYQTWEIHDQISRCPKEEWPDRFPPEDWYKFYYRK